MRAARATCRQDQVKLPLVGKTQEMMLERLFIVRNKQRLRDFVTCSDEMAYDGRAALTLSFALATLIGQCDHGSLIRPFADALFYGPCIPDFDLTVLKHSGKYSLTGHNAVAHGLVYGAVIVELFADLGHLQKNLTAAEKHTTGQDGEISSPSTTRFSPNEHQKNFHLQ